jgi:hypothetical protein
MIVVILMLSTVKLVVLSMRPMWKFMMLAVKLVALVYHSPMVIKRGIVVNSEPSSIILIRGIIMFSTPAIIAFVGTAGKHQKNEQQNRQNNISDFHYKSSPLPWSPVKGTSDETRRWIRAYCPWTGFLIQK